MDEAKWQQHFYTEEEFSELYKLSSGFNDDTNSSQSAYPEKETFTAFMDKGSEALSRDHKNLLEHLL